MFYVGQQDGTIIAAPEKAGNYTAWIMVYDPAGKEEASAVHNLEQAERWSQTVVAVWSFEVGGKLPFEVQSYSRVEDAAYSADAGFIDTASASMSNALDLDCAVGETYRIAPIDLDTLETKHARKAFGTNKLKYSFVLENAPRGFFIDTSNGEIVGTPTKNTTGAVEAQLFVVDGSGEKYKIETISITVKYKDTDEKGPDFKSNGPNGKPCSNSGTEIDGAPFDGAYTCNCTNAFKADGTTYSGDNCENPATTCASTSPCQNGGSCTDLVGGGYFCSCASGYEGDTCATQVS